MPRMTNFRSAAIATGNAINDSAYDNVKTVVDSIDNVVSVGENIDAVVTVNDSMEDVNTVADFIDSNGDLVNSLTRWTEEYIAIEGQTVVTFTKPTSSISLYLNGVFMSEAQYVTSVTSVTFVDPLEEGDKVIGVGGEIVDGTESGTQGGQFLGNGSTKGIQYMAKASEVDEQIVVTADMNAFSVGDFEVSEGASITVEPGGSYTVL